jgi:hypothetical protein
MANAETEVDLDQLHQSILSKISTQFPDLQTVEDYSQSRLRFTTPACFVELTQLDAGDSDPGTGQIQVAARFEAHLIISFRALDAKRAIRKLAGAFSVFLHNQRWGLPVGPAQFVSASPDEITGRGTNPDQLDQYEVWSIEWEQQIHLGQSVWAGDSTLISEIYVGFDPEIGPDHQDDYREILKAQQ